MLTVDLPSGSCPHCSPRSDGEWIQTYTGRQFWPLDPRPEDVCIEDIAHALALKCRFTGHTKVFYSVAEHCVRMSHIVPAELAMAALLHDAAEAYLPDVARPVKRHCGFYLPEQSRRVLEGRFASFDEVEARLMVAIVDGLTLPRCVAQMTDELKTADLVMLATERRDLMAPPPRPWIERENIKPLGEQIRPWSPYIAELMFLDRFSDVRKFVPEAVVDLYRAC